MRCARRSHAAPSRTPVIVTTLYDGPLPWAWFMYQSRRASSPSASIGIQPSRNAASNSSSLAPTTSCTSWTNSIRRASRTSGKGDHGEVRSNLLSHRSRSVERVVHPGAGRPHLGRDVGGQQPEQAVGIEDALHERHLALRVRAERGLEAGLDLEELRRARVAVLERLGVHAARRVDVVEQLALERPHGVLHVDRRVALGARRRAPRARSRSAIGDHGSGTSTLPCTSWRKVSSSRIQSCRSPDWMRRHRRSHAAPSRTAVIGHHLVRPAAAVGVVQVPEQAGVVALGQRGHPAVAERVLERVLVVAGDLVGLVEEEHAGILARRRSRAPVRRTQSPS